jgi:MFS family permease
MAANNSSGTADESDQLLLLVFLSVGVMAASSSILSVSLPFRFQALNLPVVDYGLVVGGYALGMLILETFWGTHAFRLTDYRLILLLGACVLVLILMLGFLTTFVALLLDYTALGALVIYLVPLQRFVGMHAKGPSSEGRGVGRTWAFFGGGLAAGSAVGPLLFTTLGFEGDVVVATLLMICAIVLAALTPWKAARLPKLREKAVSGFRAVVSMPFVRVALLVVAAYVVYSLPSNYLPYYAVTFFGASQAETGYILGAARVVSLLASFFLGSWGDRHGHPRAVLISFALLAVGVIGTWFAPNAIVMTIGTLAMFAGIGWLSSSLLPLAMAPIPTRHRGSAIGLYGSMEDLGLLVGPVLYGVIWSGWGAHFIFPMALAAALVGLVLTLPYVLRSANSRVEGGDASEPNSDEAVDAEGLEPLH